MPRSSPPSFLLVSHNSPLPGVFESWRDFLLAEHCWVKTIFHPLDDYYHRQTQIFENKKVIRTIQRRGANLVNLGLDFFISLFVALRSDYQYFMGANNFDSFVGVVTKIFKPKIKVIYFGSDFTPARYQNNFLNKIYLWIEKKVVARADLVVSNTQRSAAARINLGLARAKSIIIPNGVLSPHQKIPPKNKVNDFLFVGNINAEHGLVFFLKKLEGQVIRQLTIIGDGEEKATLMKIAAQYQIKINYLGIKTHSQVLDFLLHYEGWGLAPYQLSSGTQNCFPTKIAEYIFYNVPTITSQVTEFSAQVTEEQLGIVYDNKNFTAQFLEREIADFKMGKFLSSAQKFRAHYNAKNLYTQLLNQIISLD